MKNVFLGTCMTCCVLLPALVQAQAPCAAPAQNPEKTHSTSNIAVHEKPTAEPLNGVMAMPVSANEKAAEAIQKLTPQVLVTRPAGEINWTTQYVTATGRAPVDNQQFPDPARAKSAATKNAIADAQRNLFETLKTITVVGDTRVGDIISESETMHNRIKQVVKGAEQEGTIRYKNGKAEVTLRVPLYLPNGLAPVFYNEETNMATARLGNRTPELAGSLVEGASIAAPKLVLVLNGQKFDPVLFPVLADETNALLFDISKLYDPSRGKFPKLIFATEAAVSQAGFEADIFRIIIERTMPGKLVVDAASKEKLTQTGSPARTMLDMGRLMVVVD